MIRAGKEISIYDWWIWCDAVLEVEACLQQYVNGHEVGGWVMIELKASSSRSMKGALNSRVL